MNRLAIAGLRRGKRNSRQAYLLVPYHVFLLIILPSLLISLPFFAPRIHRIPVPIRPDHRWLYPIDWPELSRLIRFGRAGGRCEQCGRPHGADVIHLGDGRWWDEARGHWRDGRGRRARGASPTTQPTLLEGEGAPPRRTRVVLATAHRDHDPGNNASRNLAALCQRCHLLHDRPEHRRRRWTTLFRRRALGDLFLGPYR